MALGVAQQRLRDLRFNPTLVSRWRGGFPLAPRILLGLTTLFLHAAGILLGGLAAIIVGATAGVILCLSAGFTLGLTALIFNPTCIFFGSPTAVIIRLTACIALSLTTLFLYPACALLGGPTAIIIRLTTRIAFGLTALFLCPAALFFQTAACILGLAAAVIVAATHFFLCPTALIFQAAGGLFGIPAAAHIVIGRARRRLHNGRPFVAAAFILGPAAFLVRTTAGILRPATILFGTGPIPVAFPLPAGPVTFPFAAATLMLPIKFAAALFPQIGIPPGPVALQLPDHPVIVGIAVGFLIIATTGAASTAVAPDDGARRSAPAATHRRKGGGCADHQGQQFLALIRGQGAGRGVGGRITGTDAAEFLHTRAGQRNIGPDVRGQGRQFQNQPQLFRRLIRRQGAARNPGVGIAHADQAQFRQAPGTGGDLAVAHLPFLDGGIGGTGTKPQQQGRGERNGQKTASHDYWPRKAVTGAIRRLTHLACHEWRN